MLRDLKYFFYSLVEGLGLSGVFALLWPEILHSIAVIFTGILSTIAIFYTRRWLHNRHKND